MAVVGSVAAERLGITNLDQPVLVYIGDQYVEVVGILNEFPLAQDLDRSVRISEGAAEAHYADDPTSSRPRPRPRAVAGSSAEQAIEGRLDAADASAVAHRQLIVGRVGYGVGGRVLAWGPEPAVA